MQEKARVDLVIVGQIPAHRSRVRKHDGFIGVAATGRPFFERGRGDRAASDLMLRGEQLDDRLETVGDADSRYVFHVNEGLFEDHELGILEIDHLLQPIPEAYPTSAGDVCFEASVDAGFNFAITALHRPSGVRGEIEREDSFHALAS
jgi:hypothetical protein